MFVFFFFFFNVFNAAYLGSQEMREVVKRDDETIKEHLPKVITLVRQYLLWMKG